MHDEKIWALDFATEGDSLKLLTGGGDAKIKLWQDNTVEEQLEDKKAQMDRISQEHQLSKLMREDELVDAALLAFKLNKLRDFYHVMTKLVCAKAVPPKPYLPGMPGSASNEKRLDPVESILMSQQQFQEIIDSGKPVAEADDY